jgi:hypothetical protein
MGAILNSQLAKNFAAVPGVPEGSNEATLLNVEQRESIPAEVLAGMQDALAQSLHSIYFFVVAIAIAMLVIVLFFPRGRAQDLAVQGVGAGGAGAPGPRGAGAGEEVGAHRAGAPVTGEGGSG